MGSETASIAGGLLRSLGRELRCKLRPPYPRLAIALALMVARREMVPIIADDALAQRIASAIGCAVPITLIECSRASSLAGEAVLLWCRPPTSVEAVFAAGDVGREAEKRLKTLYARRFTESVYLLRGCGREELVEVREDYSLNSPRLSAEEEEVLHILCEHLTDFGAISVREAAELLAHRLSIGRSAARNLIVEASRKGLVVVEEGYVVRLRVCPRRL